MSPGLYRVILPTEVAVTRLQTWLKMYEGMAATQQQVAMTVQMFELLARAQLRLGQLHEAATTFDRIVEFAPRSVYYLRLSADAWKMAGDRRRALQLYDTLVAQPDYSPAVWLSMSFAALFIIF